MAMYTMTRGDTKTFTETIQPTDSLGNQVLGANGIQNWLFWLTAKYDAADPDSAAVFQKLPGQWQVKTQGNTTTAAAVFCNIVPADTASMPPYQVDLVYDVQAKDTAGNIFTLESGTITVKSDVTVSTT